MNILIKVCRCSTINSHNRAECVCLIYPTNSLDVPEVCDNLSSKGSLPLIRLLAFICLSEHKLLKCKEWAVCNSSVEAEEIGWSVLTAGWLVVLSYVLIHFGIYKHAYAFLYVFWCKHFIQSNSFPENYQKCCYI